jgi:hypothetical protein
MEDINPDPKTFIDRQTLHLLFEILNIKFTHGIDFQSFYDIFQVASESLELNEQNLDSIDDYIHINIIDVFCKNFIRGFSKLIIELGFENFLFDEI